MNYPERTFKKVASVHERCQSGSQRMSHKRTTSIAVSGRQKSKRFTRKTKAERQREIIDATIQLIGNYGIQGATVSRIAAAVGLARGALYQHFPNREAVLKAALKSMEPRSQAWIDQSLGPDVPASLMQMALQHSSWASAEYSTFVRPFFQLIASNRKSSLTAMLLERHAKDLQEITARVEEGQRQGSLRSDVAPEDVAWSVLMLAWAEDISRLMGSERYIDEGVSHRIAQRLLGSYTLPAHETATDEAEAGGATVAPAEPTPSPQQP